MAQRELDFRSIDEVLAEVNRLEKSGSTPLGNWDFAQICHHLAFFAEGSLDGHKFRVPWIFKALFGKSVLRRILTQRIMKPGRFTPQKPLPEPGLDPRQAAERLRKILGRMRDHRDEFIPSPFFGYLTPDQVLELTCIHCAHHLGFLQPK